MIDSHCHLTDPSLLQDLPLVLEKALESGITHILSVACSEDDFSKLERILDEKMIFGACGIHPEYAADFSSKAIDELFSLLKNKKILGVGETGLDAFYGAYTLKEQEKLFFQHIELSQDIDKPLIIHTREAEEQTERILTYFSKKKELKLVLHCFTGSQRFADWAQEMGFYISVSGIITFNKAEELRNVIQTVPLERLLIETDAPYLAPIPYRGKRNEPSFLIKTAERLAKLKQCSMEDLEQATTHNFKKLFGL